MKRIKHLFSLRWQDGVTLVVLMLAALDVSLLLQPIGADDNHASLIYVLAVFLVARYTNGYLCGLLASIFSAMIVNYAFVAPYYSFNLEGVGYPLSFATLFSVSIMTSVMTAHIKEQESFHWDFRGPLWVLDPVDGTTNLIHDFRHSAISLALIEAGQPQKGIVYSPFSGEMFTAERGGGAFRNGRPILVSSTASMREALLSVGTAPGKRNERGVTKTFERMKRIFAHCQDIRRMGAASLELCYVACGRLDGYFEEHLKPWDYAAGKLIVEEAGGTVCGLDGREAVFLPDREIVAAGGEILGEFLSVLRES